jgi:6-phosphogluconolactonase/glucosamine-6-phosphate isomerase/deaminase
MYRDCFLDFFSDEAMRIEIVKSPTLGLKIAKALLYKHVDLKTVLFLSGGTTAKPLYQDLAREKKLHPGAVAYVDERYGPSLHPNSNEKMIKETGLIDYLASQKIPFYPILRLHPKGVASDFAKSYNKKIKYLLEHFSKRISIMGIGEDGHIAGLPAKVKSSKLKVKSYVAEIRDFPGKFKQRITLTFKALSQMDLLIVFVFGSAKKKALNLMFTQGSVEEIPARFFKLSDVAKKTILITDQKVYNNY